MEQHETELSSRLAATVAEWRQEVGQAQQALVAQIDTANRQLGRLLQALGARQEQAATSPATEAMGRELAGLLEKLGATVRGWTAEVTGAHAALGVRIERAAATLDTLAVACQTSAVAAPAVSAEDHDRLHEDLEALREEMRAAQAAAENAPLAQAVDALRAELAALRAADEAQAEAGAALRAENETLAGRVTGAEEALAEAEDTLTQLRRRVDETARGLEGAATERDELRVALLEREEVIAAMERRMAELMETERAAARAEEAGGTAQLEEELAETRRQLDAAVTDAREARDTNARLEVELGEVRETLADCAAQRDEARTRAEALEADAEKAWEKAAGLDEAREELRAAEAYTRELERQVAELSDRETGPDPALEERVRQLEAELAARDEEAAALREMEAGLGAAPEAVPEEDAASLSMLEDFLGALEDVADAPAPAREAELEPVPAEEAEAPEADSAEEAAVEAEAVEEGPEADKPPVAHIEVEADGAGEAARLRLGEVLIEAGVIREEELQVALLEKKQRPDILLGTLLLNHGYVTEAELAEGVARQLGLEVVNPSASAIDPKVAACGERGLCTWHVCVPIRVEDGKLVAAMSNPLDEEALVRLGQRANMEVVPVVATASQILTAIEQTYGIF